MQTAASIALPLVGALVCRAQHELGSRMLAYDHVARRIGATASWVRKFTGNQPVALCADKFLRIHCAYQATCDHWDSQADKDRAAFFALGNGGNDAMATSANTRLDVAAGNLAPPIGQTDAVVASLVDEDRQ